MPTHFTMSKYPAPALLALAHYGHASGRAKYLSVRAAYHTSETCPKIVDSFSHLLQQPQESKPLVQVV